MKAVLGLGSNIGEKQKNIERALSSLNLVPGTRVLRVSSFYATSPVGFLRQDDFINACAEIETSLSPGALLGACLGIEAAMGRERPFQNSPRVIDIDMLIIQGYSCCTDELIVPHLRMFERAFVLVPLKELYPDENALGVPFDFSGIDKNDTVALLE